MSRNPLIAALLLMVLMQTSIGVIQNMHTHYKLETVIEMKREERTLLQHVLDHFPGLEKGLITPKLRKEIEK